MFVDTGSTPTRSVDHRIAQNRNYECPTADVTDFSGRKSYNLATLAGQFGAYNAICCGYSATCFGGIPADASYYSDFCPFRSYPAFQLAPKHYA
jgi:hypothetical protein